MWLVGSNLTGQVLQFAFGIVLARLLVPADFGKIVTIQVFTGFVGLFASGGMGQALIRAKLVEDADWHVVFSLQLAIGIAVFTSFFAIAPLFSEWFHDPIYESLLRVSALSFLMRPFLNMQTIWLNREMRFKEATTRGLIASIASNLISIAMAASGFGVWSLVVGGLLGSVIQIALLYPLTPVQPRLNFDRRIARVHSTFGIKITLNDFISYMRQQICNLIITKLAGAGTVGLFNKGESLSKLPFTAISGPIYQPVLRTMAENQDDPDRVKYLFFRMISLLMVYTLPIYVGLWWLADPFIQTLYGPKWAASAVPLEILAPLGLLYCIGHPCGAVLAAMNWVGREVVVQAITLIIVAIGCYIGLEWGLAGVAFGIVISQIYATIHMYFLASRCIRAKLRELIAAMVPGLMLNAVLIATLAFVSMIFPTALRNESQTLYLLVSTISGALAYTISFLYFPPGDLSNESRRWKERLHLA
ncbi:lipopolysaccharide biosynthesis protein [Aromatoleum petrolei]|nr:lipopolysaccharide biosynthesis protein [Aromatoleum petrolei]